MVGCGAESWWVFHTAYSRVDPLPDEVLPNVADSTGDCVFIPSRWYHYVDSSRTHAETPELNMGLNVWWPRVDLLDEATVDDENQDAGTSAPAHLYLVAAENSIVLMCTNCMYAGGCPKLSRPIPVGACEFTEFLQDQAVEAGGEGAEEPNPQDFLPTRCIVLEPVRADEGEL